MTKLTLYTAFTSMILLAACGQRSNSGGRRKRRMPVTLPRLPSPMAAAGKAAKGSGIVTGIDKTAGTITLKPARSVKPIGPQWR